MITRWRPSIVGLLVAATALGCTSPEASRTRGGGPGADVGNHRRGEVQIHAGADMYYRTPTEGAGIGRHAVIGGAAAAGSQ